MKILCTIGFTKKSLKDFVFLLKRHDIRLVVDIRLKNNSQLAGFAKGKDLAFILEELLDISYIHEPLLSPNKNIFSEYRKDKNWVKYTKSFERLMEERNVENIIKKTISNPDKVCLLCSEDSAEHCHRRLIAKKIQKIHPKIEIKHLSSDDIN